MESSIAQTDQYWLVKDYYIIIISPGLLPIFTNDYPICHMPTVQMREAVELLGRNIDEQIERLLLD